jgi:hypothetical protein
MTEEELLKAPGDEDWWVRMAAAQSLCMPPRQCCGRRWEMRARGCGRRRRETRTQPRRFCCGRWRIGTGRDEQPRRGIRTPPERCCSRRWRRRMLTYAGRRPSTRTCPRPQPSGRSQARKLTSQGPRRQQVRARSDTGGSPAQGRDLTAPGQTPDMSDTENPSATEAKLLRALEDESWLVRRAGRGRATGEPDLSAGAGVPGRPGHAGRPGRRAGLGVALGAARSLSVRGVLDRMGRAPAADAAAG